MKRILFNFVLFISLSTFLVSCNVESASYGINIIYTEGSTAIGFLNKTFANYSFLTETVDIESLIKAVEGSVNFENYSYNVSSQTQPLHPGDEITILLRAPVKHTLHAYISLFGSSYLMTAEENTKIISENKVIVSGNRYSYNSSTYNSVLYVLKYQVPDVESGKHIVAICVSDDKEEVYKGFGYISVDKKQ